MAFTTSDRIIDALMLHGPAHRAELARVLEVSRTSVTNAVDELRRAGVVDVPARAADRSTLKDAVRLTVGFGVAATIVVDYHHTIVGIGTLDGELLAHTVREYAPVVMGRERLQDVPALVVELMEQAGEDAVLRCAHLAVNTQADRETGEVLGGSASARWADVNPKRLLEETLGVPVKLENTARLLALAEHLVRVPRSTSDLVYVQLSYGVAMGHVVDGVIIGGGHGGAGELGHVSIDREGRPCSCANRGCLMQYVGSDALLEDVRAVLGADADIDTLIHAAHEGNFACQNLLKRFGRLIGEPLASVCNLIEPSLLVIGGALNDAGRPFLDAITEEIRARALPLASRHLRVEAAYAQGDVEVILAAGLRALRDADDVRRALWSIARGG